MREEGREGGRDRWMDGLRKYDADASRSKKCSILAFALPSSLLCFRQDRFHGDIADTRAFPLALPFLTLPLMTKLYASSGMCFN